MMNSAGSADDQRVQPGEKTKKTNPPQQLLPPHFFPSYFFVRWRMIWLPTKTPWIDCYDYLRRYSINYYGTRCAAVILILRSFVIS